MKTRVRMYRQGLGDCFLLSFDLTGQTQHLLVDCGVLLGTANAEAEMTKVARNIFASTGGKLTAVVATHEHWDHLSGFLQARPVFDDMQIRETWFAWTENKSDAQARRLRGKRDERKATLAAGLARFDQAGLGASPTAEITRSLLGFFGEGVLGAAAGARSTRACLDYLVERPVSERRFLEPGNTFLLPGRSDVRFFVLGPPRDERLLRKDLPSNGSKETFLSEHDAELRLEASFSAAINAGSVGGAAAPELVFPFDRYYRIPPEQARQPERNGKPSFFAKHYGFDAPAETGAPAWRRIDADWLGASSDLALALDSDTNNTSLVLAVELGPGGDVILLAADAQVGNWLSWKTVTFQVGNRTVRSDDLLARTVLYKVGHHGSHNATLRAEGLDKMTSDRLVAMIPVQRDMALTKGWNMPFEPLFDGIESRCQGRVLRIDEGLPADAKLRITGEARTSFRNAVAADPLFVDCVLGD